MNDENVVPPARYIFLIAGCLIAMISAGSSLGFYTFGQDFIKNMNKYNLAEIGRGGRLVYYETPMGEKIASVDIGFDLNSTYNATHGVAYWFGGIDVLYGSTIIDVIQSIDKAKTVEIRVYDLNNTNRFDRIKVDNPESLNFQVTYGNISGMRYIEEINGIKQNVATNAQWMPYYWNPEANSFVYITASLDRFVVSHKDSIIIIYDIFGGWPADCCSGGTWEYNEYEGALQR